MSKLGIHLRLLLCVFALIIAITFTLGYIGINISREFIQGRFEKRVAFLAKYLALNAELGVLIDNRTMLDKLAANLMTEDDIAKVVISDEKRQQIVVRSRDIPPPLFTVKEPILLTESTPYDEVFEWNSLTGQVEKIIGFVDITYSTVYIEKILTVMKNRFIWFSAGLACLAALIFYFLSRSMVRPVTQLAQVAREVAQGDMELRAQPGGLPETRDLAMAFNSMLDSIKWNRDALEEAYQEIIQQTTLAEMGKFSLMVAHEFKNPLSIIKSSLDVLKGYPEVSRDDPVIFYMEDEIERMNRMIEDFLAFARPGRPCFRQVDVSALVVQIVEKFQLREAESGVDIFSDVPPQLCHERMDPDMFSRVITNILKNAVEAIAGDGEVFVRVLVKNEKLRVEIEDSGDGIESKSMEKLFEPFFTTRSKGTGLGLAYAMQVVKAHSGEISARNNRDKGACFIVRIPLGHEHPPQPGQNSSQKEAGIRRK